MSQLILDLGHRPALGRQDFLVAPSNQLAVTWIDRWPDWPGPVLAIFGPAGSGKSHLLQVWRAMSGAELVEPAALQVDLLPELLGSNRCLALDGLDTALGGEPQREEALLHLYNMIIERGGHLLLTGREAPARWQLGLADLQSRLTAVQTAELGPPDDDLIEALLVKLFADRQLMVGAEVVRFLLTRMERSFEAARGLVEEIDRRGLETRREITVPLARQVLQDLAAAGKDGAVR